MRKKLFFTAAFLAIAAAIAPAQTPDQALNPGSSYVDAGRGIPWGSSFNRTYVLTPNSPNASVCIYVVNNNPTNAHAFTITTFQAGDSQVADFSNNQGRYNAVPLIGMPASVPALNMVSGFLQSTSAAKVAVKFSATSALGGSPDTADIFLVQTTSGTCGTTSTGTIVQGTTTPGAAVLGNPVLIGGKDLNGNARFAQVNAAGTLGGVLDGLMIGTTGIGPSGTFSSMVTPNGSAGGPLAMTMFALQNNGSILNPLHLFPGGATSTSSPPGLYITNTGYFSQQNSLTINSTPANVQFTTPPNAVGMDSCYVTLIATNTAGTAPTLDAYFQTGTDGTNWTDRIHFAQVTTGTSKQFAGIAANVGLTPAVMGNGTLAVSTKVDGPIGSYTQFLFIMTGTTPSYTVSMGVACK
jgi:hypothetical protein